MDLNDCDYLIATMSDCPKIASGMAKWREQWASYSAWRDAVLAAWGIGYPSEGVRTITGNGLVHEVKVKGLIPHYSSRTEATDAAAKIGSGAKVDHRKECGWFVKVPLRSEPQKIAVDLATKAGLVGSDSIRNVFYHLGSAIERNPRGLRHWFAHPGLQEYGGRVLFTLAKEMDDWRDSLIAAGAKPATLVEAAQFVEAAKAAA